LPIPKTKKNKKLTPRSRVLLEKLMVAKVAKKFQKDLFNNNKNYHNHNDYLQSVTCSSALELKMSILKLSFKNSRKLQLVFRLLCGLSLSYEKYK
jgi:hypothetical protein